MKYQSKKAIKKRFVDLRKQYRDEYKRAKEAGAVKGSFAKSTLKKLLDKKEKGAIYRYVNRSRIAEQKRAYREKVEKYKDFTANVVAIYDGTAIGAYSGGKHGQDRAAINAFKAKNFVGVIIHKIENEEGEKKIEHRYRTQGGFFSRVRQTLSELFSKAEGYRIFSTEVQKYLHYDKQTDTVYFVVNLNEFSDE